MLSLRAHAWICGGLFGALIGFAILGNVLQAAEVVPPAGAGIVVKIVFLTLFVAFGFSCIPVMVKLVIGAQRRGGDPGLAAAENIIIWVMWGLIAAGSAIALPFAIKDGFLSSTPPPAAAPDSNPELGPRP